MFDILKYITILSQSFIILHYINVCGTERTSFFIMLSSSVWDHLFHIIPAYIYIMSAEHVGGENILIIRTRLSTKLACFAIQINPPHGHSVISDIEYKIIKGIWWQHIRRKKQQANIVFMPPRVLAICTLMWTRVPKVHYFPDSILLLQNVTD